MPLKWNQFDLNDALELSVMKQSWEQTFRNADCFECSIKLNKSKCFKYALRLTISFFSIRTNVRFASSYTLLVELSFFCEIHTIFNLKFLQMKLKSKFFKKIFLKSSLEIMRRKNINASFQHSIQILQTFSILLVRKETLFYSQ